MKMLNNKGVTIVMLVITIIVLLLLTAFAVFYSTNIAPEARIAAAYNSLKEIRRVCNEAVSSVDLRPDKYEEYDFFGKNIFQDGSNVEDYATRCGLSSSADFGKAGETDNNKRRVYKITPENDPEVKRRIQALELSAVSRSYIIDLDNSKYYLVDGIKRKTGELLYEYKDIQGMYEMLTDSKE